MSRLRNFVADLLIEEGALVDPVEPEGLEVLAPPAVREALGVPEWTRLGFGAELPAEARRVGLETDWLERLGGVFRDRGRRVAVTLEVDNPAPANAERVLEHGLVLLNATYRLVAVRPAWTRYLIFNLHYTARSDETRDGVLPVGLNLANGAVLDGLAEELWSHAAAAEAAGASPPLDARLPPDWERERLNRVLERLARDRVRRKLEAFLKGMRRRMERDQARLHAYHDDLRGETLARLAALPADGEATSRRQADKRRDEQRLEAIRREHEAKIGDLRNKYAMTVAVEWIQTLDLATPVQRFELLIRRRKGERRFTLDWNPLVRRLEQAPCEYSQSWERPRMVCDETLHLVSTAAHADCSGCGKAFCRACHPRHCPKCGHRVGPGPSDA